jgi:hypothetical protein
MGSHECIPSTFFIPHILIVYGGSIRGGINKISINIVCPYSSQEYFSFPLVLKQNSPFFLPNIHNASQGIHFSIKALMFTLLNSL